MVMLVSIHNTLNVFANWQWKLMRALHLCIVTLFQDGKT